MRGRRPREDRSQLLSRVIAVRLTEREGEALDAMVEHHNRKLRQVGLTAAITAASFARSCVIQAAVRAGLLPPLGGEGKPDEADEAPLVVVPPLRRSDPAGAPLPPPSRFDRALDSDTVEETRYDKRDDKVVRELPKPAKGIGGGLAPRQGRKGRLAKVLADKVVDDAGHGTSRKGPSKTPSPKSRSRR